MCVALVAGLALPRMSMASQLGRIRRERTQDKKDKEDALQPDPSNGSKRAVNRLPNTG